ncbi:hypothetical protein [Accumulibacter sp.]|uniref:hypothetical protein n=1 Tax=Accumulibacter sp. TaxID=2053492 RepID=UPI0025E5C133|nr:hypothetical protein [Accumulibacter sp.]MCM8610658.1 hypothetical protein [Accumulibacter sp.]MCM8634651.1 hypothetical protein [Accumulibacter sp.]
MSGCLVVLPQSFEDCLAVSALILQQGGEGILGALPCNDLATVAGRILPHVAGDRRHRRRCCGHGLQA